MTADTNEALDALVKRLREAYALVAVWPETRVDGLSDLLALRNMVSEAADMLTALAAKLAEAEAAAEGALMILMDERAELAQVKADADARVAAAYELAADTLDTHGDRAVNEALGQKLCCSGHHCGCMGADVGAFLQYLIRSLTPADADAALSRIRADARRQALQEAEKIAAGIAGNDKAFNADRRRGAGEVQAAIRARIEAKK